jgi:hypothetical protein
MLEQIRAHYKGFSFDGETLVYNPFSTLGFFTTMEFDNYWVKSGSLSFIREFLKERKLTIDQFKGMGITKDFADAPGEIEKTSPAGFLYQTGYLTIRKDDDGEFNLDYPNFEVLSALSAFFLENAFPTFEEEQKSLRNVRVLLERRDLPGLVEEFNRMYASVSYLDYIQAERKEYGESFYRAMLHVFLNGAGIMTHPEEHNNRGRVDIVAVKGKRVLVIEMKMAPSGKAAEAAATGGMSQMRAREYGNRYLNPMLLSLAVDLENRRIGAWKAEDTAAGREEEDPEEDGARPSC